MLHDKLEQANREVKRKRLQGAMLLLIVTTVSTLLLAGIFRIDLSLFNPEHEAQAPKKGTITASHSVKPLTETEPRPSPAAVGAKLPPLIPAEEQFSEEPSDVLKNGETRKIFKEALADFEENLEQRVLSIGFENWNIDQQRKILAKKSDAVSLFSTGNYEQALANLKDAIQRSSDQLAKRDSAFDQAFSRAKLSYEDDDFDTASLEISDALRWKPRSSEALELSDKINLLPNILSLIERAAIARTENNLEREEEFLKEVIHAAPSRTELTVRLKEVRKEIREQRYAKIIDTGLGNIDQRLLVQAQLNLKKARSIYGDRAETKLLAGKVATLQSELEVEKLIQEAQSASQSDDWVVAESLYLKAVKIQPNNIEIAEGYALSKKINALSNQLSRHIQKPHRLSASNVAKIVKNLVAKAENVSNKSPSISMKTAKLSNLLTEYSLKVPVRVISDASTNISVRGVGRVGIINEKIIKLRPGRYTFEGIRSGFKAKLVQIVISPGSSNQVVKIICDERI